MTGYRDVARASSTETIRPLLLRPEEAAAQLNISRTAVYGMIGTGELTSITIGRRRRIPQSAVDKFIAARLASSDVSAAV
jgi:excisionase family DNA binding protein